MSFPKNFVWGAATASYQIEGAAYEDGKGLSVWDMMTRQPGRIWRGHTGDVASDHYHHYKEDVALMKRIGLGAYRLSISWPRVLPAGVGQANEKGLDFYDKLIDELLAADIQPWVTLFHWDYPYDLYCRGGWLNRDSPDWFAEYTRLVVERLSDRVQYWMPYNEPQCFMDIGHRQGTHAPGDTLALPELLLATHHALLAHGKSVQAIRAASKTDSVVGLASIGVVKVPVEQTPENIEAARAESFSVTGENVFNYSWWLDPIFFGRYPQDGLALFEKHMPACTSEDMATIKQPLDFLGVNIYSGDLVRVDENGKAEIVSLPPGNPVATMEWINMVPEALYWGPRFAYERYKLPIYVTENGMSNVDWVSLDGKVHDPQRIDYTTRYLRQLRRAIADGVDVRGYLHWSLMDNFEWAEGFRGRFGLIHVDYPTGKRTLKDSAGWYGEVIRTNGESLGG